MDSLLRGSFDTTATCIVMADAVAQHVSLRGSEEAPPSRVGDTVFVCYFYLCVLEMDTVIEATSHMKRIWM